MSKPPRHQGAPSSTTETPTQSQADLVQEEQHAGLQPGDTDYRQSPVRVITQSLAEAEAESSAALGALLREMHDEMQASGAAAAATAAQQRRAVTHDRTHTPDAATHDRTHTPDAATHDRTHTPDAATHDRTHTPDADRRTTAPSAETETSRGDGEWRVIPITVEEETRRAEEEGTRRAVTGDLSGFEAWPAGGAGVERERTDTHEADAPRVRHAPNTPDRDGAQEDAPKPKRRVASLILDEDTIHIQSFEALDTGSSDITSDITRLVSAGTAGYDTRAAAPGEELHAETRVRPPPEEEPRVEGPLGEAEPVERESARMAQAQTPPASPTEAGAAAGAHADNAVGAWTGDNGPNELRREIDHWTMDNGPREIQQRYIVLEHPAEQQPVLQRQPGRVLGAWQPDVIIEPPGPAEVQRSVPRVSLTGALEREDRGSDVTGTLERADRGSDVTGTLEREDRGSDVTGTREQEDRGSDVTGTREREDRGRDEGQTGREVYAPQRDDDSGVQEKLQEEPAKPAAPSRRMKGQRSEGEPREAGVLCAETEPPGRHQGAPTPLSQTHEEHPDADPVSQVEKEAVQPTPPMRRRKDKQDADISSRVSLGPPVEKQVLQPTPPVRKEKPDADTVSQISSETLPPIQPTPPTRRRKEKADPDRLSQVSLDDPQLDSTVVLRRQKEKAGDQIIPGGSATTSPSEGLPAPPARHRRTSQIESDRISSTGGFEVLPTPPSRRRKEKAEEDQISLGGSSVGSPEVLPTPPSRRRKSQVEGDQISLGSFEVLPTPPSRRRKEKAEGDQTSLAGSVAGSPEVLPTPPSRRRRSHIEADRRSVCLDTLLEKPEVQPTPPARRKKERTQEEDKSLSSEAPQPQEGSEAPKPQEGSEAPKPQEGSETPKPLGGSEAPRKPDAGPADSAAKPTRPARGKEAGGDKTVTAAAKPETEEVMDKRSMTQEAESEREAALREAPAITTPKDRAEEVTTPKDRAEEVTTPKDPTEEVTTPKDPTEEVTTPKDPTEQVTTPKDRAEEVTTPKDRAEEVTTPARQEKDRAEEEKPLVPTTDEKPPPPIRHKEKTEPPSPVSANQKAEQAQTKPIGKPEEKEGSVKHQAAVVVQLTVAVETEASESLKVTLKRAGLTAWQECVPVVSDSMCVFPLSQRRY